MMRTCLLTALLAVATGTLPSTVHAWGALGHRLVARLAEPQLTPEGRAEVRRLLATEGHASLADIANWADDLRGTDPDLGKRSAKWHYVNLGESGCRYNAAACPGGDCVVEAIRAQAARLADRSLPDAQRLQALKFVVHFVGDIHQPMHAGYAKDRGGNTVQVRMDGEGTNLHALWDSRLLASARRSEDDYARALRLDPGRLPAETGPITPSAPAVWAEQSCAIAVAPGVYPAKPKIGADYLPRYRPVAEVQVQVAAARLSALLDETLSPTRRR